MKLFVGLNDGNTNCPLRGLGTWLIRSSGVKSFEIILLNPTGLAGISKDDPGVGYVSKFKGNSSGKLNLLDLEAAAGAVSELIKKEGENGSNIFSSEALVGDGHTMPRM